MARQTEAMVDDQMECGTCPQAQRPSSGSAADVRGSQPLPTHLTAKEVGEAYRITARSVTGMAQRGEIPAHKIGGVWRFNTDELRRWYPTTANR